eukprot:9697025-Karenia_brevis.AAC.1
MHLQFKQIRSYQPSGLECRRKGLSANGLKEALANRLAAFELTIPANRQYMAAPPRVPALAEQ